MASRRSLQCVLNRIRSRSYGTVAQGSAKPSSSSQHLIDLEHECSAHNYHPIPMVFSHAEGSSIWDPEDKKYLDFLSAYSAVNQILGKALGGGVIPVSAVLADKDVMLCIQPGEHGSTFGGNPLASAVAIASLQVIKNEELAKRSDEMGQELRNQLMKLKDNFPEIIKEVRGRGLFNAVELNSAALFPVSAYDLCLKLKNRGILAKPTHDSIIR